MADLVNSVVSLEPNIGQPTKRIRVWRVLFKAIIIFAAFNIIFYVVEPMKWLNKITVYNTLVPGRLRIPFSESQEQSHTVSILDLNQIFASHVIAKPKTDDEYRVVMLGDSSIWGYLLQSDQTESSCLNQMGLTLPSGKKLRFYNFGYPKLSASKDLLLLQKALEYQPDLIIWSTTLASLYPTEQLNFQFLFENRDSFADLMARFNFKLPEWPTPTPTWRHRTLLGQRISMTLWLRYQLYGLGWGATQQDYFLPKFVLPHPVNLANDDTIFAPHVIRTQTPRKIVADDLALDLIRGGIQLATERNIPVLIVNEPISHPGGQTRINFYYPQWAYDGYRTAIHEEATRDGWNFVDFWDTEPSDVFTDTDFHMTPQANCDYAAKLKTPILQLANGNAVSN